MKLNIQSALPDESISHFVHSFWMLENKTGKDIPSTILPNGMVDMTLMKIKSAHWEMFLRGIDTEPSQVVLEKGTTIFTIDLKLLAVEYLLGDSIKDVLNEGKKFSNDFWQFEESDMSSLENFCNTATQKIKSISTENIGSNKDLRKVIPVEEQYSFNLDMRKQFGLDK